VIVVNVNQTWPLVKAGTMNQDVAVLGVWPIAADKLAAYGDVLLAAFDNVVVAAYDIVDHERDPDTKKVTFEARKSEAWGHLVGQPNPGKHWGQQGDAWPVRYVDTTVVADGDVPVQDIPEGRRAVVGGYTLTIGADSNATVLVPAGRTVTVQTA
jgi:hypothetical protein